MYIIVNHLVKAPNNFWGLVQERSNQVPSHLTLHTVYPSVDLMRAVCVWEAESVDVLKDFLDEVFGDFSRNDYFEVNNSNAIGLPVRYKKTASL